MTMDAPSLTFFPDHLRHHPPDLTILHTGSVFNSCRFLSCLRSRYDILPSTSTTPHLLYLMSNVGALHCILNSKQRTVINPLLERSRVTLEIDWSISPLSCCPRLTSDIDKEIDPLGHLRQIPCSISYNVSSRRVMC